jgi:hypothetical protein
MRLFLAKFRQAWFEATIPQIVVGGPRGSSGTVELKRRSIQFVANPSR